ncbi:MAG: hypothetical protein HZB99_03365 [Candidatus Harrisonbacteria bacterium]|nr:hypothetical protein [Candidatus Harrisonbacteria bacterium]
MAAPLISLICLIFGMTHQIKIIIDKGHCEELSLPRIFLGTFSGVVWVLYGLELGNNWMIALNVVGIIMNLALMSIIFHLRKKLPPQ